MCQRPQLLEGPFLEVVGMEKIPWTGANEWIYSQEILADGLWLALSCIPIVKSTVISFSLSPWFPLPCLQRNLTIGYLQRSILWPMFLLHRFLPLTMLFLGTVLFDSPQAVWAQDILPSISHSQPSRPRNSSRISLTLTLCRVYS